MSKTIKTVLTSKTISSEVDLSDSIPSTTSAAIKQKIHAEVAEFVMDKTLEAVSKASSPVSGASYKASLSKEYRDFKAGESSAPIANLELTGNMLDTFDVRPTSKGFSIGHFNTKEAEKSDGHNNFSGSSDLPERRYLPKEGESYKGDIEREIQRIITDGLADEVQIPRTRLVEVETKPQFWSLMREIFPDFSRAQVRGAVFRSPKLVQMLSLNNLIRYLDNGQS